MIPSISRLLSVLLCLWASAALAQPKPVHVEAGEVGQGMLLQRLGSCYAVTPAHVLAGDPFASLTGGQAGAPRGDADVLMEFGYDLSLLRVTGAVTRSCGEQFGRAADVEALLSGATTGVVQTVDGSGAVARQEVILFDTGMLYIQVKPVMGGEPLMKGMSGSQLLVKGKVAGMLMSVDATSGAGKVLRYDRLTETIAPFFTGSGGRAAQAAASAPANPASREANLAREVSRWSASPVSAQFRVAHLLDGDSATVWLARTGDFPVDVELLLSSDATVVVSGLTLDTSGIENRAQTPRDYEIMVSSTAGNGSDGGSGDWVPVRSGTLFGRDEVTELRFAPLRARRLLLRLHSNWGDAEAVGLAGIVVR